MKSIVLLTSVVGAAVGAGVGNAYGKQAGRDCWASEPSGTVGGGCYGTGVAAQRTGTVAGSLIGLAVGVACGAFLARR